MSTVIYCDGIDGECRKSNEEVKLFTPNNYKVSKELVNRGWFQYVYDLHVCKDCIDTYYNEENEQIAISDDGYIILGKDFKAKK